MKKASDLLQSFFLKHGIEEGQKYVSFFRQWEKIVGEDVAAHADVEDIRNEALVVRVDHPAWMQILHMKKDMVLRKVNEQFPDFSVSTIHMHLDSEPRRRVEPQKETPTRTTDEESVDRQEEGIQGTRLESLLDSLGKQVRKRNREREE
jgi:hypothetical protein